MMTNIPVTKIVKSEKNKLASLSDKISTKLIGQEEAVKKVVKSIQRNRAGLKSLTNLWVIYFLGQTGN